MLSGQKLFLNFIVSTFALDYNNQITHSPFQRNRCTAGKLRPLIVLNDSVRQNLESGTYKARKHPGINKTKTGTLPQEISSALEKTTRDYPIKTIVSEGQKLARYLKNRHPPIEADVLREKTQKFRDEFIAKKRIDLEAMEEQQRGIKERAIKETIQKKLKKNVFNWYAMKYDQFKALQYLLVRSPPEYAVIHKVFSEIKSRDPSFHPRGFFDFGSGVGTAVWALSSVWDKGQVFEYYLCDASRDMNELSELVLRGGDDNKQLDYKNINYRQFLPASSDLQFNLVVSAYSLFELDSRETRLKTVQTLWDKCEDYLVLVENGSRAGFELINEAREFILEYDRNNSTVFSPVRYLAFFIYGTLKMVICVVLSVCSRLGLSESSCERWDAL